MAVSVDRGGEAVELPDECVAGPNDPAAREERYCRTVEAPLPVCEFWLLTLGIGARRV